MDTTVPESHRDLLTESTVGLSTLNPDGTIQTTAVWVMLDDDGLVRTSLATARYKYQNLRRHPYATIFALDATNPYRSLELRAEVQIAPDDDARTFTRRIIASYGIDPGAMQDQLDEDRVVVTFVPRRVIAQG